MAEQQQSFTPFVCAGKQILANGFHYCDAVSGEAAENICAALNERGLLKRFAAWADRVQDGENGVNYLNGEKPPFGNGDDAWADLDALRAALASAQAAK